MDLSHSLSRHFDVFFVDFLDLNRSIDLISTQTPLVAMFHVESIDTAIPVIQLLIERRAVVSHLVGLEDRRSLLSSAQSTKLGYCTVIDSTQQATKIIKHLHQIVRSCAHHPDALAFSSDRDLVAVAVHSKLVDQIDLQILSLISSGIPDSEIASTLSFSRQTVRNRVSKLLTVVGATNRTELAIAWRRHIHRSSLFAQLST